MLVLIVFFFCLFSTILTVIQIVNLWIEEQILVKLIITRLTVVCLMWTWFYYLIH